MQLAAKKRRNEIMSAALNLIAAIGVDAGAHDIEMPKPEGDGDLINKVIRSRRMNALALKRMRYPRCIRLR
jgi:hypothetical protein